MRRTAFRRLQTNIPISWLLRDEFSDTRAAGAVNGTMATPGPGDRVVVADTGSFISVANDALNVAAAGAFGNAIVRLRSITRAAGRLVIFGITQNATSSFEMGLSDTSTASRPVKHCLEISGTSFLAWTGGGGASVAVGGVTANTQQYIALMMRSSGYIGMASLSNNNFLIYWIDSNTSTSAMHLIASNNNATVSLPFCHTPADLWLPAPLVSDGFGSTFGTTDGLGHAEGVSGGIGSGGGNVTLTQQIGTWANSAGKAAAATLSGGVAVATVPLSTKDVSAKVKVTRSAGSGGMVLRWTDSSNYLYAEHDGTNAYLKQVLSGSTTTLITAAATYSAGAELVVDLNGTAGRLYYNNALVGTTSSINSGLTATAHGLRSTDTGGIQLDDLCIYAKGTGGEYNLLNRYVNL